MQLRLSKEKPRNFNAIRKRWDNDNFILSLGAGKTTLVKKLSEKDNFEISISHTTSSLGLMKINKDYFFVDELKFKRLIKNEGFRICKSI